MLCIDSNDHMSKGKLAKLLRHTGLKEMFQSKFQHNTAPASWFQGSNQIDGIWVSRHIINYNISIAPHFLGVGDHRCIVFDIPADLILGASLSPVCRPTMRKLISSNPISVNNYVRSLQRQMSFHNLYFKQHFLISNWHNITPSNWDKMLNCLDEQFTRGRLHAEDKCRKLHTGKILYSPNLSALGQTLNFWNRLLHFKELGRNPTKELYKKAKLLGINFDKHMTTSCIIQRQDLAEKTYLEHKPNHVSMRTEFVSSNVSTKLKQVERSRKMKARFKRMGKTFAKSRMGSIHTVEVVRGGRSITVSARLQVEAAIINNNKKRFTLAHQSPLLQDDYFHKFGAFGQTDFCNKLLDGTADLSDFPSDIAQMLRLFHLTKERQPIPTYITPERCRQHWKSCNKRTSSSISGLHFRHQIVTSQNDELCKFHIAIINLCIKNQTILKRWMWGLSVMLMKKEKTLQVDKLRAILLLEADINALAKIIFNTRLMPQLELNQSIPPQIIGARRGQSAIHSALN